MNTLLTLLLVGVAAAQTPAASPAKAGDIDGKKIYSAKCVTCHGKDLKGTPAMAKMLKTDIKELDLQGGEATKKTDAELTKIIADGRGKMTAFKNKLKDDEIVAVLAFVRSSQTPAASKTPTAPEPQDKKKN